ncbi:hypothetical protein BD408DRAFT_414241 [Parasitella parasitica]|nr:hypothetical protein BD408DRAFT_414241 [Parasitella parasitica]
MASTANNNTDATNGLPVIPLSPIAQSYIICSNALNVATEKLTEAKKANPPVQVGVLRGLLETSKVEAHRLNSLTRKMQSVEAATALFWDSDALARQIAVIDCQLYGNAFLDKRSLSQLDKEQTKLNRLVDFHHYLAHSVAHQLIYWAELVSNLELAADVVPPVHPTKDSLVTHFVRVAYLLLHAYRDFSGFAAIMKALTFPEVRRLNKKLWHNCSNSRTKDMFRELANLVSPAKSYAAYQVALRSKLEMYVQGHGSMMIAVPWIQPHLLSIRSIATAYTAGDNDDQLSLGDIVLSAPGARKLNMELSILELCQQNICTSDLSLEEILSAGGLFQMKPNNKRASMAASANKAIHIEGLRAAVIPVANLNHLAPGEQLTHHWLVSRAYLRKDQLINESMEVEPLKAGETITCDSDEFEETRFIQPPVSKAASRRTSVVPLDHQDDSIEQELVDMSVESTLSKHNVSDSENDDDDQNGSDAGRPEAFEATVSNEPANKSSDDLEETVIDEHEVTLHPATTEATAAVEQELSNEPPKEHHAEACAVKAESASDPLSDEPNNVEELIELKQVENQDTGLKKVDVTKNQQIASTDDSQEIKTSHASPGASQSDSTSVCKEKSRLSPTAPEFVPGKKEKANSVTTNTTDEQWFGYPIPEAASNTNTESEKWGGYPVPSGQKDEEIEEVWNGYPGPISSTGSPRRASSQSETSEEWKGYHATKMEATWQRESALKVQEHEWQGYALETLDEDELDSSTMMDGEFEKSRQARGHHNHNHNHNHKNNMAKT